MAETGAHGPRPSDAITGLQKTNPMTKNSLICMLGLAVMAIATTASKKESQENIYAGEIAGLEEETLIGGGQINPDSLNGKMLILSFWASYDATSRVNAYDLVNIRDRFHNEELNGANGLEVVCISLDVFKSPVRKAIEADGTQAFYHICDFKGEDSPLASRFDVNRPVNLLISPDGRIVARDFGTTTIAETLKFLKAADGEQG